MIKIQHTYSTHVLITYYYGISNDICPWSLEETMCADMDTIAEHVCDILVGHNFVNADVQSAETGEILMIIERE